ncbi:MAG: bacteriohemerythrin [Treponema sp.]|jgi:hemerythrin-like metal-binding protein|nr:bacteriohemerythrin [Treponema sp.]
MNEDSVTWDNSFSVGFDPIDDQHKELVKITNELFQACEQGVIAADMVFLGTVKKALDYAETHFADEEEYMHEANYPHLGEQKNQHAAFVAEVQKSIEEFEAGNIEPVYMARFLKKWLLNHIAVSDKQYAPYLAKI